MDDVAELESTTSQDISPGQATSAWSVARIVLRKTPIRDEHIVAAVIVLVIGVSVGIFFLKDTILNITNLSTVGYAGVFLFTFLGAATIFLPSGGSAAVILSGAVLNPVLVGLLAGIAAALGELTGYVLGYEGSGILEKRIKMFPKVKGWMEKRGSMTIFLLSVLPNPLFDAAGLAAGAIRFPLRKFLFFCWSGKTIQALGGAFVGALGSEWLINLAEGILP